MNKLKSIISDCNSVCPQVLTFNVVDCCQNNLTIVAVEHVTSSQAL